MDGFEYVKAEDMICPERFDLISKIKYVENSVQDLHLDFIKKYYLKTIEAFTEGTYIEEDGTDRKKTADDYLRIFDEMIYDIKDKGVDPRRSIVPVTQDGVLDNGAHRTAIAIYFKQKIPIQYVQKKVDFNYAFFRKRLLDEKILDWTAKEYCRIKNNVYLVCIWPRADHETFYDVIYHYLKSEAKIVYEKKIKFTKTGFVYFIAQTYAHQDWVGTEKDHFSGAVEKARNCWDKKRPVLSFVIEADTLAQVQHIKDHIRNMFGIGNHSIHITDDQNETIFMVDILYNANSLHLLNCGMPDKYQKSAAKRKKFANYVREAGMPLERFVVDSSSVLALYGLREADDIDYLYLDGADELFDDGDMGCHERYLDHYGLSKNEMILDPDYHLVYDGVKFVTLDVLMHFKRERGEKKDIVDCGLIKSFLSKDRSYKMAGLKLQTKCMRIIRDVRISAIHLIKKLLLKAGIYECVKRSLKR